VPARVLDAACGGGSSVHLNEIYLEARFTLEGMNSDVLAIVRSANAYFGAICKEGDIYRLDEMLVIRPRIEDANPVLAY
jgi:hypothetical protein